MKYFQSLSGLNLTALEQMNLSFEEKWPPFEPSGSETSLTEHQEQFQDLHIALFFHASLQSRFC